MKTYKCLNCGKEGISYRSSTRVQQYCCFNCYQKGKIGKHRFDENKYQSVCVQCGKVFTKIKPSKNKQFCSNECCKQAMKVKFTGRKRPELSGNNHPNWKGGKTTIREILRKSIEYKQWRDAVFKKDNYTCVWCGDKRGGNLEADHIKPFCKYPELIFDVNNGRTLCHSCHILTPTYLTGGYRGVDGKFYSPFKYE